jgi:hypothetical protein
MRIELDKPLTKAKLRQALKMANGKKIKIIMGTEIFDVDTIVSKNDTIYLCTDSTETSKFYEKRVIDEVSDEEDKQKDYQDPIIPYPPVYYTITHDKTWQQKWEEYRKKHNLPPNYIGDTPGYGDDITCHHE